MRTVQFYRRRWVELSEAERKDVKNIFLRLTYLYLYMDLDLIPKQVKGFLFFYLF